MVCSTVAKGGRNDKSPFRALTHGSLFVRQMITSVRRNDKSPFRALTQPRAITSNFSFWLGRNDKSPFRALYCQSSPIHRAERSGAGTRNAKYIYERGKL